MLPKIKHPIFNIDIPSTKKKAKFRPFLVKEEKILLIAKTAGNVSDVLLAVKQIVNNCAIDTDFNVDNIAIFDLEYIYLKLYAASVNNKIKAAFKDNMDDKVYNFEIPLDELHVNFPETVDKKIQVTKDIVVTLKYPAASLYEDKEFLNLTDVNESLFELIINTIDKIYEGDTVYDPSSYPKEEVVTWIEENLDAKAFEKIQTFLNNLPNIEHVIKYKNSLDTDRKIELTTFMDFFYFL